VGLWPWNGNRLRGEMLKVGGEMRGGVGAPCRILREADGEGLGGGGVCIWAYPRETSHWRKSALKISIQSPILRILIVPFALLATHATQ
jgi:hypothetical protein